MRPRRIIPGTVLTVIALVVAAAAPAASIDPKAAPGTVIAKVRYTDPNGTVKPLVGVEVFLWNNGTPVYGCTNAKGKVKFAEAAPGVNLLAATGVGVSNLDCANKDFLRPEDGHKMLLVGWDNHHGSGPFDTFQVAGGQKVVLKFKVRTPDKQWKVCAGHLVTMKGTNGPDNITGTAGDDVINALDGDDVVHGGDGADVICGGNGKDKLYGDDGDDWLLGENGKDRLFGNAGTGDRLDGGPRSDRCKSGETYVSCETIL